ncbi:MAG: PAS domain-containing protein [Xanthomonadales bacterium PRO7]|jgi:two-component system nitrogen regulation sensor histidine kinase GlnL|nr:PAS domain-containing protein [Xanthomonadales bacterium PRO7]HMM56461.1 nitrogen regulation protein NR(II) [Rudaea sp.]
MFASSESTSISTDVVTLLDQLTTGVAVLDDTLRFVHANPAFVELTGLARWRGCPLETLGESSCALTALIERAFVADSASMQRGLELSVRSAHIRIDVTASRCDAGVLLEMHPHSPLDSTSAPVSQSLRGLAHEVKNPLAGLRGAAQLLRRRLGDPDQQRLAELIIAEADRLGTLTDRLLHPGGKPHLSVVNLHEVAERARALIAVEAAPETRLERDYDPSLPVFRGDADRLLQLLLNLLRNALQAGATTIRLRTRAEHAAVLGGQSVRLALRLDVIDNGQGVPESLRESLFAPLVSGRAGGTGLGLALAREVAIEHGGQLDFRSRPGHTVFSVLLPLEFAHG